MDSGQRIGSVSCNLHGRLQSGWFSNLTLPSAPVAIQPMGSFTGKLVTAGVEISMDGRGRFMDNIFIERLWRSIKYEEVHLKAYADGRQARAGIGSWMTFYNFRRPHQAMNNQMPMAVWRGGMDKIEAAARAVDMPLRLDNANALPTYPQLRQKQQEAA